MRLFHLSFLFSERDFGIRRLLVFKEPFFEKKFTSHILQKWISQYTIEKVFRIEHVVPTIFRVGPYRFYFYSHKPSEPPHVHVDKESSTAKFWLKNATLADSSGFARTELNKLQELVEKHRKHFLDQWHEYFGT